MYEYISLLIWYQYVPAIPELCVLCWLWTGCLFYNIYRYLLLIMLINIRNSSIIYYLPLVLDKTYHCAGLHSVLMMSTFHTRNQLQNELDSVVEWFVFSHAIYLGIAAECLVEKHHDNIYGKNPNSTVVISCKNTGLVWLNFC